MKLWNVWRWLKRQPAPTRTTDWQRTPECPYCHLLLVDEPRHRYLTCPNPACKSKLRPPADPPTLPLGARKRAQNTQTLKRLQSLCSGDLPAHPGHTHPLDAFLLAPAPRRAERDTDGIGRVDTDGEHDTVKSEVLPAIRQMELLARRAAQRRRHE